MLTGLAVLTLVSAITGKKKNKLVELDHQGNSVTFQKVHLT